MMFEKFEKSQKTTNSNQPKKAKNSGGITQSITRSMGKSYKKAKISGSITRSMSRSAKGKLKKNQITPSITRSMMRFICEWDNCGKSYKDNRTLLMHIRTKHGEKFICEWDNCGKSFEDYSSL